MHRRWVPPLCAAVSALMTAGAGAERVPEKLGVSESVHRPESHWTFYLDYSLSDFHGRYVLLDIVATRARLLARLEARVVQE